MKAEPGRPLLGNRQHNVAARLELLTGLAVAFAQQGVQRIMAGMNSWPIFPGGPIVKGLIDLRVMRSSTADIAALEAACDQVATQFPSRRERFQELCRSWKRDARWISSTTKMAMHPSYQHIIGMGPDALPLILGELNSNPGHWFGTLKSISSEDPVPPRDRGAINAMRNAWLEWGKTKGYLA